jgi:hypothetical protein
VLGLGDTFLLPKSSDDPEHLWVVVTPPDPGGKAVCVNITTAYPYSERTTLIQAGEHPFVKHESVVRYSDAKLLDLNLVQKALDCHQTTYIAKQHQPCSSPLLKKVQEGLLKSKSVVHGIKQVCQKAWEGSTEATGREPAKRSRKPM